ncbi:MAG: hypothetical protein H7258_11070 [Ferruginibacter sp.]|nr:hypothetical protein [Ferruginibacter sp.]
MAKSAKVAPKKPVPLKQPGKKITISPAANKTATHLKSATEKPPVKKPAFKKVAVKKETPLYKAKLHVVKKSVSGKAVENKTSSKTLAVEEVQKGLVRKPGMIISKSTEVNANKTNSVTSPPVKKTTIGNDSKKTSPTENGMVKQNGKSENSFNTSAHVIPSPEEKYARPGDPFNGKKTPVRGKLNTIPSGKKPLWNK